MAQARVTEFFSAKKRTFDAQPSKRRKLASTNQDAEVFNTVDVNVRATRSSLRIKNDVAPRAENAPQQTRSSTPKPAEKPGRKPRAKPTKGKQIKGQSKIKDAFEIVEANSRPSSPDQEQITPKPNLDQTVPTEEVTSAWDEHDGPLTPSKRQNEQTSSDSEGEILSRKRRRRGTTKEVEKTPLKNAPMPQRKSRKKLQMRPNVIQSSDSDEQEQEVERPISEKSEFRQALYIQQTPPAISPLPDTPEVVRRQTTKGPDVPTSAKVKAAMEQLEQLKAGKTKKLNQEAVKEKLSKVTNLQDLKAQLAEMKQTKAQLKKSLPSPIKTEVSDVKIKTEEITSEPCEKKAPAYERFHSLAAPAPPTLSLPYKYKLLADMFRGMDTVVSMLHNRSEVCTFSKLKAAVQEMTKRNFEEKNVGQIKTVYPSAYTYRQEKGLPAFGNKVTGYQLTMEPNLSPDNESKLMTKNGNTMFSAKHLLERRSTFHNKLITIVKKYHKEFLASLDRPLSVPDDKITRWHPKFNVDTVPDVKPDDLPQPPTVKKYHTAKDVLEDTRGKLPSRVEKALESVAMDSEKSTSQSASATGVDIKPKLELPQYKGVPQSLLEKIRAKEAKKQEEAMMRNPEEDKRTKMLNRLPEMMRMLRSHFVTEKKPALPLDSVIQKLTDSYRTSIRADDVEAHVKMMVEISPEWLKIVKIKAGSFVKMDRNIDLQQLADKVTNMAKR
ncbi:hypothetical protein FSP39_020036 [Pinctada imbricata]|uniref:CDT1 Geminin-binding domain-containing protein n=1 Tax=Pinctada imbricata TaxID=66713 RepID=A0AA88XJI7_PINIB|nr:hypothetical protein FSP39_020036 [Pinctada imbricata]